MEQIAAARDTLTGRGMDLSAAKRAFYLGRYNCVERLASGPLGETFRAKIYGVAGFEKQFSVKKLHAILCQDEEFVARFVKVAGLYAGLEHERIAHVHEVNVQGTQYYLASDLIRGAELERIVELLGQRNEAFPSDVALLIASDAAEALIHAHGHGLVHAGLAPHAILLGFEGDVRVADVGLLGALVRPGWADDDELLPALAFVAPEVLRCETYDARADVFSLAAVLYEMLSGRRPYRGLTARDVKLQMEQGPPASPPGDQRLQALLSRALHPHAERRPESVEEFRRVLAELLGGRAARARSDLGGVVRRLIRPERKTGSFPVVAAPPMPPATTRPNVAERPWAPPARAEAASPTAPIGPQLSTIPPRNTFAGLGPDDQVLVPIELLELPGSPTARELPAVTPSADDATTTPLERIELEPDTEPIERIVPANGAGASVGREATAATPPPLPMEQRREPPITPLVPQHPLVPGSDADAARSPPAVPAIAGSAAVPPPFASPVPVATQSSTVSEAPASSAVSTFTPTLRPRSEGGGSPIPPPLELPPLPSNRWRLVVGISLGVTALASGGLYFAVQHEASAPKTTLGEGTVPPTRPNAPPPVVESPPAAAASAPSATGSPPPAAETAKPAPPAEMPKPTAAEARKPTAAEAAKPTAAESAPANVVKPAPLPTDVAAAAPPSAGNGTVDVRSNPAGAQVWIDGTSRGPTPLRIELSTGSHTLLVLAEGTRMHREVLRVSAGATQLDVQLPPATLPATVAGDAGLKVRCKTLGELRILVDGADTGRACPNEQRISVAPGPHKIGLYSPRADKTYEVDKELPDDDRVSTRVYVRY